MERFPTDARLRALLAEADRLLDALGNPDATSRADVVGSLDDAHRDLGRRLHDLWLDAPERRGAADREPALAVAELSELEPLDDHALADPLSSDWVDALQDLLALLGEPPNAVDPVTVAVEASRVQWASVGLSERWARFPRPIRQALVGLIAARPSGAADRRRPRARARAPRRLPARRRPLRRRRGPPRRATGVRELDHRRAALVGDARPRDPTRLTEPGSRPCATCRS
jgi:hypothetical protein